MSKVVETLLETTYTADSLQRKVQLLEEFYTNHFYKEKSKESIKSALSDFLIEQNVGEYLRTRLLSHSSDFYKGFTAKNYKKTLRSVMEEQNELPSLVVYVPVLLPPIEVEKLGQWARENVAPGVFLKIEVDLKVIGGCAFVWNGVYHDYSLRYQIDKHKIEVRTLIKEEVK